MVRAVIPSPSVPNLRPDPAPHRPEPSMVPRPLAPFFLLLAFALAAWSWVACSSISPTPVVAPSIPGATFVGNQQCLYCHTNYAPTFEASIHFRVHIDHLNLPGGTSCETCHGPGSLHVNAPRDRAGLIVNPGRNPQACLSCHIDVALQFRLPSHHPVPEGHLNCVDCHDPHGREIFKPATGLAMARVNEQCVACHRDQARTFVFEHEALREGCTTCHQPHGSIHRKLLTEADAHLCLKCHAQIATGDGVWIGKVDHRPLLALGSCWSAGCHTAVHGSHYQPKLLY